MLKLVRMEELDEPRAPARFPAASSSAWRWRARWRRSPKVLLLDEPLSALDYKLRKEMQIELKRLQHETGITFIFVTHDQEEALTMSDRIAVMSSGQDPADRHAARDLRPPGRALRRRLHRRDQFPRRPRSASVAGDSADGAARIGGADARRPRRRRLHARRQGDGGGAARACAIGVPATAADALRHAREHRLFRHRHAFPRAPATTAARSSCASRTAAASRHGFAAGDRRRHRASSATPRRC